jgi:4-hydroxybenzoate polyprenyltransferase
MWWGWFNLARKLLELVRFSHTVFALPFALTGAALAWKREGKFEFLQLVGILLCMVLARSVAMAFNRLVDHRFDAENPRTASRHLPAGTLSRNTCWVFFLVGSLAFVLSTLLFLLWDNPWPVRLSLPVLAFICGYSYAKRFTALAHFWLGASLLLTPLAAWIAIRGIVDVRDLLTPVLLGLAVLFWVAGFDILYACQDVDFDRKARLLSIPAAFGITASFRIAFLCHMMMLVCLIVLFQVDRPDLGWVYLSGVAAVALLLLYEHSLVRPDNLARINQAFFHVNAIISIGLFVIVLVQLAVGT